MPLHYNLYEASHSNGEYDMSQIFAGTLTAAREDYAVTFVDNHDTQVGQSLQSWIDGWFKVHAYSLILLRKAGVPVVFWGIYLGFPRKKSPLWEMRWSIC